MFVCLAFAVACMCVYRCAYLSVGQWRVLTCMFIYIMPMCVYAGLWPQAQTHISAVNGKRGEGEEAIESDIDVFIRFRRRPERRLDAPPNGQRSAAGAKRDLVCRVGAGKQKHFPLVGRLCGGMHTRRQVLQMKV